MDKIVSIKIKQNDGTYSNEIPIYVTAENVEYNDEYNLIKTLGYIDVKKDGTIQEQINKITSISTRIPTLENRIANIQGGTPTAVDDISGMIDTDQIYILSTDSKWYYYDLTSSAWVAGGAYGGVPTDTTLTESGMAADAAAVGSALGKIKEDLNDIETAVNPLVEYDSAIRYTDGYYIRTGNIGNVGTIVDLTPKTSSVARYAIIPCNAGERFKIKATGGNASRAWAWTTEENAIISNSSSGAVDVTITAPTNAKKLILNDTSGTPESYKKKGEGEFNSLSDTVAALSDTVAALSDKFVSTSGNDNNDGNSSATAYATVRKALLSGAKTIYIARGTYNEESLGEVNTEYRYKSVNIIADSATVNTILGLHFRHTNVNIRGLNIICGIESANTSYGFFLLNCTGAISDCSVAGAKGAGGFRLDGSNLTLTRCTAYDNAVDGFNGHTVNSGYETDCSLIDCKAYNNGDDGLSFHERGTMYVDGGEYYSNASTGIAPHQSCKATIRYAYIHDNGHSGVEFFNPSTASGYEVVDATSYGNLYKNNGQYGINTQYYNVISVNDKFANNVSGTYNQGTGAALEVY